MVSTLTLGDVTVDVVRKDIKNVHLSVYPPAGRVRLAAPLRMTTGTIRLFAIAKLSWIRRQQRTLRNQERESQREYLDRESHYVWGRRVLLRLVEEDQAPTVKLRHSRLLLTVRPGMDRTAREKVVSSWYRQLLKDAIPPLIAKWAPRLGVEVEAFFVQKMKTKWGSCNPAHRTIRLNTELARKPRECLEYIVVHELAHLSEPSHNERFVALMDRSMPQWRIRRDALNSLPVRHEDWGF